jgi:hypothetical protein
LEYDQHQDYYYHYDDYISHVLVSLMLTLTPRRPLKEPLEQKNQHDDQNNRHQDGDQLVSSHALASFLASTSSGTIPVPNRSKQTILKKLKKKRGCLSYK